MKNLLLLLTISLVSIITCHAQDKGYVAVSMGPSFPVGGFANKDLADESAGAATTGAIFDISFAYKLGKNFGLSALLRGQANPIDNKDIEKQLNQTGDSWNVDKTVWSSGGILFGGYGSFPISSKVSFDTRAMIGVMNTACPELNVTLEGTGGEVWINQSSVSAASFAYLIGGGIKYDVGKKICLLVNIDYLSSKPEFTDVEITSSDGSAPQIATVSQSIGTINVGFGVGLRL
jgi:hypothetical protein